LLNDERIDQVIWRSTDNSLNNERYHIRRHGYADLLTFSPANTGDTPVSDSPVSDGWGNRWELEGDLSVIDASVNGSNELVYGQYPNALERIAATFSAATSGNLWITAKLGYEFTMPGTRLSRAGSHGSLHRLDSLT